MDASSAALLPNKQDMIIGAYNGDLLILSNHKIHMIYNKAHEKEIDFIAVRN